MRLYLTILICLWICLPAAAVPGSDQEDPLTGQALVDALLGGGFNIYFRHAATDWSQDDHVQAPGDWTSCDSTRMRQLSDAGRAAAKRIGRAIRRLSIPIGPVFSSEYCRAKETAEQMDLGPVSPTLDIMNMRAADFVGGREAVTDRARQKLSTPPPAGTNALFVAHGNLMRAVFGAYTGEGGAVIFDPLGDGEFRLAAELTPDDWDRLADTFADTETEENEKEPGHVEIQRTKKT